MKTFNSDKKSIKDFSLINSKTIYGPVKSWRFKMSLGVDPIFTESTCSFNCFYCQLGNIQKQTCDQNIYVQTEKVIEDFTEFLSKNIDIDVISFSGCGEPTLASNLGEISNKIQQLRPDIPQIVLTNGTLLQKSSVQESLQNINRVIIKLDAHDDKTLQKINRPVEGVTFDSIVRGIIEFKKSFKGIIDIQTMFCSLNDKDLIKYAEIINQISPSAVQLNTPKRPYPLSWHRENRGNHDQIFNYPVRPIKSISKDQAVQIETELKKLTSSNILSIYH